MAAIPEENSGLLTSHPSVVAAPTMNSGDDVDIMNSSHSSTLPSLPSVDPPMVDRKRTVEAIASPPKPLSSYPGTDEASHSSHHNPTHNGHPGDHLSKKIKVDDGTASSDVNVESTPSANLATAEGSFVQNKHHIGQSVDHNNIVDDAMVVDVAANPSHSQEHPQHHHNALEHAYAPKIHDTHKMEMYTTETHSLVKAEKFLLSQVSLVSEASQSNDAYGQHGELNHSGSNSSSSLLALQQKWATNTIRSLKKHAEAGPFLRPVDPVALGIPDYFNVVKNPMDFGTAEKRIPEYLDIKEFVADVGLVFSNCFLYNPENHPVHSMGRNVQKAFNNLLKKMPVPGDELRITTKNDGKPYSMQSSPASNRPHRDSQRPNQFFVEEPKSKKKSGKRNGDELRWCQTVHREMLKKQHETYMFVFYLPVDPVALNIPQYFEVIKHPMDLSTMKKKLDNGEYCSAAEYEADFRLMINNCLTFNRPGDAVYSMGERALEVFNQKWNEKPMFSPRESVSGSKKNRKSSTPVLSSMVAPMYTAGPSDFDTSTDDDEDAESIQIRHVKQQIQLLKTQLDALRQQKKKKQERRLGKPSGSRRSSKGSNVDINSTVAAAPAPPKPPKKPREPKPPKIKRPVGRPPKSIDPPEIREITFEEKRELSEAIPALSADKLTRVVAIIHESMPHLKDNAGDEIELDIDSLDLLTLNRLWYFVKGSKKPKKTADTSDAASKIADMEMILAQMDGRTDKMPRFQGLGNDSSSDSSDSESGNGSGSE
eukprot:Partr_v1_DN27887_c0_g1_i7_m22699 putative bromodomain containing